jgi:peroxiredoxin
MGLAAVSLVVAGLALAPRVPSGPGAPATAAVFAAATKELELLQPPLPKTAEDFTAPELGGGAFHLAAHRGKTVLVNFWATWCPPCLAELPAMERLWQRHKGDGFVIVAVSLDADPTIVPSFVEARGVTFPVVLDPTSKVASSYGVRALPASFVIDRGGIVAALALGPRAWDGPASHALVESLARRP